MGTRERRQKEVAAREQTILDAALELIRRDGLLNLQMARIAGRCDYAVGTLYQHFACKEDLLIALATCNTPDRVDMFRRVAEWKAGTRDRMVGITMADVLFVRRFPDHFRLMQLALSDLVWRAASQERRDMVLEASRPLGQICRGIIDEAVAGGDLDLRGSNPAEMCLGSWAMTLGVHTIVHVDGLLQQQEVHEPYRVLLRHVHKLFNGLGWKPFFDPDDDAALDQKLGRLCKEVFHDIALQ